MASTEKDTLKRTFDDVAELYDRVRPGYPPELFDDLIELGGLHEDAVVLEIGCGTGQATRALARRGYSVVCVELGANLAAVARERLAAFPRVRVVTSAFETWWSAGFSFDMVGAATSWHWIDADVRYEKAAQSLKPAGALAIVATHHVVPEDGDPLFAELQAVYEAIGEDGAPPRHPHDIPAEPDDIEASGLFRDVQVRRYLWDRTYTADEYVALLNTYSNHRRMRPDRRELLFREIRRLLGRRPDNSVRKHYLFTLQVARRAAEIGRAR